MARTTKVLTAPYSPDGSLLHFAGDYRPFSHYESTAGERLERSDIWEPIDPPIIGEYFQQVDRQIRHDWKVVYHKPEWRPNEPFHATLQIKHMMRGRSAKYLMLGPVNAPLDIRTFPMFVADLIDIARLGRIQVGGVIEGPWMVAKRGENYGLRLAKEEEQ